MPSRNLNLTDELDHFMLAEVAIRALRERWRSRPRSAANPEALRTASRSEACGTAGRHR
jgi:hypothetical protein